MSLRAGSRAGMRVPTAQRQINEESIKSIGFTTNTKVIDRAVSRQGLTGAISGSGGQKIGRKIQYCLHKTSKTVPEVPESAHKKQLTDKSKEPAPEVPLFQGLPSAGSFAGNISFSGFLTF